MSVTDADRPKPRRQNWKTISQEHPARRYENHGCHPFGERPRRAPSLDFPDGVPKHAEALYGIRPELIADSPTHDDKKGFWRLPTLYTSVQEKNMISASSSRSSHVGAGFGEYEGGGERPGPNPGLARAQRTTRRDQSQSPTTGGIRDGEIRPG